MQTLYILLIRKVVYSAYLLLLIGSCVKAQEIHFDHLTTKDGLSQDIVKTIAQDHYGFMWFGTEDGLNRYDGYSMKVYKHDPRDSTTVSANTINDIYEDTRGRLWIATDNGLDLFDRNRDKFIRFGNNPDNQNSLSNNIVTLIREDRRGNLWIATAKGLNRYDGEKYKFVRYFHHPHNANSISSDEIVSLLCDRNGTLWISTSNGICRYDDSTDTFRRFLYEERRSFQRKILQLYEDRSGKLWAIQADRGVWNFDIVKNSLVPLPLPTGTTPANAYQLANGVINNIAEDKQGNLWIGHFIGLDLFNPQTRTSIHYSPDPMNPAGISGRVIVVYRDRVGVMWLGTFQGGVDRCDPNRQKFLLYTSIQHSTNSLSSSYVSTVLEDKVGYVWIGTNGGLDRFDPHAHTFTHYRHNPQDANSIGGDQINALCEDSIGKLWIGVGVGESSSLDCLDRERKRFTHYPITSVKSILEDSRGILWVGKIDETDTGEDIVRMNRNGEIISRDTLVGTGVWCMYEDHHGSIWLGGQYCCLNRFDAMTKRFTSFTHNQAGLSSAAVRSIYEDDNGYFWLATWGGGLNCYIPRTNTFTYIIEQDGLPSNYVKGILADDHGNLWISTEKGLSRFDRNTRKFKNYTTEDGLQGERFLSGSCFKGKNGWMYFGGTNGLNMFHPDSVRDNPNIPSIVITSFKVFDKPFFSSKSVSEIKEIHLAYDQDFFSFEFVALDYTAPQRNQYAYKLEGFDRNWVEAGTRRYAAYTRLSPGEYTFRVRGSNNDGVWNNEGTSVKLFIAPPFWLTWWFYTLITTILLVILYVIYHYRVRRAVEIERLRTRIASDLHDELASNLSSIAMFGKIILDDQHVRNALPAQSTHLLDRITELSQSSITAIRDIIWAIDPRTETLGSLLQRLIDFVTTECRAGNVELIVEIPPEHALPTTNLTPEQRKHLWLILKEAVHNALKHSQCTTIKIEAQYENSTLVLSVKDNGIGIHEQSRGAGKGFQTMRMRAEQLGTSLSLTPNVEAGTNVMLTMRF